jgi:hypothetical protein
LWIARQGTRENKSPTSPKGLWGFFSLNIGSAANANLLKYQSYTK